MSKDIQVEPTPNPNALKFILKKTIIDEGKATFNSLDECQDIALVRDILSINGVTQVHLFENVISVTKKEIDWGKLTKSIESVIMTRLPVHNSDFNQQKSEKEVGRRKNLSLEVQQIEEILDETVRAGLQADGGDIQILEFKDNKLLIKYEGACGTCPSATTGTLYVIEAILRDRFNPEIEIINVD